MSGIVTHRIIAVIGRISKTLLFALFIYFFFSRSTLQGALAALEVYPLLRLLRVLSGLFAGWIKSSAKHSQVCWM